MKLTHYNDTKKRAHDSQIVEYELKKVQALPASLRCGP